ncbi:MAG TPA: cytochrome c [Candidatus Manganitrophaceae bacterium]|nr:cytochrome c [Candidatus Manganitrophaceae bacterium]
MRFIRCGWLVFTVVCMGIVAPLGVGAHDIPSKIPKAARERKNPLEHQEAVIRNGEAVYDNLCLSCHGPNGKGDGPAAAALQHRPPDLIRMMRDQTDGELFWKITRGGGAMPSYEKTLTEGERWEVIHALRMLGERKGGR